MGYALYKKLGQGARLGLQPPNPIGATPASRLRVHHQPQVLPLPASPSFRVFARSFSLVREPGLATGEVEARVMSTFNGIVREFPDIRSSCAFVKHRLAQLANNEAVDFFRRHAEAQPPLACFLSHVHSDHLAGLESLRSPFVYCSAATKEMLLRLERYPCRINFARGILESRQQTYKHLRKVLKPLPLETPTTIELQPGHQIQVTLFDANHCLGAVMFLIEGDGRAILYTGDIRSEPWFVNSLARSPNLIEYTSGIKILDKIYLDTSFIKNIPFQTKAEGIADLLRKVSRYSNDTVFHFQAWTFGYEDVWVALSKALKSPIHVDDYKLGIYGSLRAKQFDNRFSSDFHLTPESPALTGYMCGNSPHPGCLTSDQNVRLHSCEKGNVCEVSRGQSTVLIQPVVAHLRSGEMLAEAGVGGGGEDLVREAELDFLNQTDLDALVDLVCCSDELTEGARVSIKKILTTAMSTGRSISLDIDISSFDENDAARDAIRVLAKKMGKTLEQDVARDDVSNDELPKTIRFPYSRHSSYAELCDLVNTFRPKDVWPCTVNPSEWLREGTTIKSLFGEFCSGETFVHDLEMEELAREQGPATAAHGIDSQTTADSNSRPESSPVASPEPSFPIPEANVASLNYASFNLPERLVSPLADTQQATNESDNEEPASEAPRPRIQNVGSHPNGAINETLSPSTVTKRGFEELEVDDSDISERESPWPKEASFAGHALAHQDAYYRMLGNATSDTWESIDLISTSNEYTTMEQSTATGTSTSTAAIIITMALAELLEALTWGRIFGYGALFLLGSFIVDLASQPRYPKDIPMLGHGRGWWAKVKNSVAYFSKHQTWIKEGYQRYGKKGLPFIAPAPISRLPDVILPQSQIAWMMDQPDRVLSAHNAHNSILYTQYNFLGSRLANEPFANRVMHKYLARHLPGIIPSIDDEVTVTVDKVLGFDTETWKSVNLWDMWLEIVPPVTSRLLVGPGVCRDETFLKAMVSFTDDVVRNSFLLHMFPKILHPILGRLFTIPNWLHWKRSSHVVLPVIQQRLLNMMRQQSGDPQYKDWVAPEDFITWDIRLALAEENVFELDSNTISKRLLPIEFAAIHTTVLTGQSWMFDLLSTPPEDGILDVLRDEFRAHKPAEGNWTKAALSSLLRVDSSIRESQRLSNFAANLVERMGTHHDEELYEGAQGYDPLRFSRVREAWEEKPEEERQANADEGSRARALGMVTTSDKHLAFGHGRHACPGRFFVAYELKLIMAHLLLNYDIKMLDERPQPQWIGATIIPPLDARIEIRRKKVSE
ncbi:hypothetical protein G7046_g7655 [Stylonectria norvegica]|nr:hypothetical protein G7046_g7655 [Stylonectria norvegica]